MATLYPFSNETVKCLQTMPGPGGTHRWLAQVAGGLNRTLSAENCFSFLRKCCDQFVDHRIVPDTEIEGAVQLAYGDRPAVESNFGRQSVIWPLPNSELIARVHSETNPLFDVHGDSGLAASDVLPALFQPGELICSGRITERPQVRPLLDTLNDAEWFQFIVVNPMRGLQALNHQGKPSARCQNNVGNRRHLVAEFDDPNLTRERQACLISKLSIFAPLVLVVDSGGKSLHAWFRVDQLNARDQVRFFSVACLLGADPTRWDICGWLRMPGGLRVVNGVPSARQRILYFNQESTNV